MKKLMGLIGCLFLVLAIVSVGFAGSEMGAKMAGNVSGEIVKISGEMVDVKSSDGKITSIHLDPKTTKKKGELKVGAMVGADVNDMGHANSIWVQQIGSEMGAKMAGNVSGEIVKISGEMVDVKDSDAKIHSIHIDPTTTKKKGELKVGAMVGADVNDKGHANSIWVEESKKK